MLLCGTSICSATAIHRKEGCSADFTCTASSAPIECDNCTGYGWLTWTKSYTNCSGGTTSNNDCDDQTWDLPWGYTYCSVPEGQNTFDVDLDVSTNGAVNSGSGDCEAGSTTWSCHWDITVHRQYDAVKTGNWEVDSEIVRLYGGPIAMTAGVTYSYQATGTTSTTTGWTFSFTGGAKGKAVEGAVGAEYSYESSTEKSFSTSASYTALTTDQGRYLGVFAEQTRMKVAVTLYEWGCSGQVSATPGTVYKVSGVALLNIRLGNSAAAVANQQQNESLISGGSVTGGPI